jgi:hypothetical protein
VKPAIYRNASRLLRISLCLTGVGICLATISGALVPVACVVVLAGAVVVGVVSWSME